MSNLVKLGDDRYSNVGAFPYTGHDTALEARRRAVVEQPAGYVIDQVYVERAPELGLEHWRWHVNYVRACPRCNAERDCGGDPDCPTYGGPAC